MTQTGAVKAAEANGRWHAVSGFRWVFISCQSEGSGSDAAEGLAHLVGEGDAAAGGPGRLGLGQRRLGDTAGQAAADVEQVPGVGGRVEPDGVVLLDDSRRRRTRRWRGPGRRRSSTLLVGGCTPGGCSTAWPARTGLTTAKLANTASNVKSAPVNETATSIHCPARNLPSVASVLVKTGG